MKRIQLILIICGLFHFSSVQAQNYLGDLTPLMKYGAWEVGFHGVNLVYYLPTSSQSLLELKSGVGPGAQMRSDGIFDYSWILPELAGFIYATQRFYLKRGNLVRRNVNSFNNAGNFIGVRGIYSHPLINYQDFGMEPCAMFNIHYGIHRSSGNGKGAFTLHGGMGYGYSLEKKSGGTYPAIGFTMQWKLTGRLDKS
jgi:hypothetical protein